MSTMPTLMQRRRAALRGAYLGRAWPVAREVGPKQRDCMAEIAAVSSFILDRA